MMAAYEFLGLTVLFWWVCAGLFSLIFWPRSAQTLGLISALVLTLGFSASTLVLFTMASFGPFGAVFPALLIRHLRRRRGADVRDFSTAEIIALFVLYSVFIFASAGWFDVDPYALGYAPISGSLISLVLLGYSLVTGRFFMAGAVLVGQLAWTFDVGSSNIFDHLGHGLLWFALFALLLRRALALVFREG